ncbi:uncharacterized protein F4817DRAFT_312835 [Daldinia loculata]|uniref:uncharacterized protein n=1 Tax=Daldinia loculata TaxID=103429 RepID=UPI0020C2BF2A|nr:uncharacterized protein F4817DRAFT_312835 [Daldinia loculata]KAI1650466.1 hypothetical protein F4817DRAFT_312835 [Daldinia loculata]
MSKVSVQQDLVAERVSEALRHDFPKWVAEKEARDAAAAQKEEKDTEFFLVSNWAFHPDGLQEFTSELRRTFQGLQVSYDLKTSWVKVKCLTADEAEVMAACQLVLDNIAQRELAAGLSFSNKVFPYQGWSADAHYAGTPDISELRLAAAPPEIQAAASRALWKVPEGLLRRGPNPLRLATAEVLAKLQHITGCALALESDGLAVFIGGESLQEINVVIRKLDTLARYAGSPYQADTRCESFIYAEDKQHSPAAFTYMAHGGPTILRTFFLDRAKYELAKGVSVYGKMFEQGVVVALPRTGSQPTKGPATITPAISLRDRNEPFKAFLPTVWRYEPKDRNYGTDNVLFDLTNNPEVASWVVQVPKPEYNQSWELSEQPSYKHQSPAGRPSVNLDDENVRLVSQMSFNTPTETVVEQSSRTPNNLEILSAEQDLIGFDQQQTEELSTSIDKESEKISITQSGTQAPQHPPASEIERDDPFIKLWKGVQIGELRVEPSITPPPRRSTMRQQAGRRYDDSQIRGCPPSHEQVHKGPDPDPELTQAIAKKLVRMMGSLETFTGKVSLKAELGRFCLTKVNRNHVCLKDSAWEDKVKSLQDMKEMLDRHHVRPRDVIFTNFLTGDGEDANYIAYAEDSSKQRLWALTTRHTVYEIHCRVKTADEKVHKFTLEVDAKEFTYRIYGLGGDSCAVFVHCPKRMWDFQVTLTKLQDLGLTYGDFAEDLINSMRVIKQDSGIPLLEFIVKGVYQAEILLVRTRNVASYARNGGNIQPFSGACGSKSSTTKPSTTSVLEICEVHDMAPRIIGRENDNVTILFEQYSGNQQRGQLPTWYEVSLQSKVINEALQQNRDLEMGEEVSWTPQQLQQAGAFDEIITSAIEVVKNIDGVGHWGDNLLGAKIHKMPSSGTETYLQPPTSKPPV